MKVVVIGEINNLKQINMTKAEVINEILKVILHSEENVTLESIKEDYDEEFAQEIWDYVSNWVNNNNVENVEFTLDKESLMDVWGDWESIKNITNCKISFEEDYSALRNLANNVFKKESAGPGWNGYARDDNRWNDEYFFTGSDCTYYVLVKKL